MNITCKYNYLVYECLLNTYSKLIVMFSFYTSYILIYFHVFTIFIHQLKCKTYLLYLTRQNKIQLGKQTIHPWVFCSFIQQLVARMDIVFLFFAALFLSLLLFSSCTSPTFFFHSYPLYLCAYLLRSLRLSLFIQLFLFSKQYIFYTPVF